MSDREAGAGDGRLDNLSRWKVTSFSSSSVRNGVLLESVQVDLSKKSLVENSMCFHRLFS
eukprot:scaffold921_cov126-Cylindrotheca_fusiformis.AAC.19